MTEHAWPQILVFDGILGVPEDLRPVRVYAPAEEACLVTARICILAFYMGEGIKFTVNAQWAKGPVSDLSDYEGELPSFD